MKSLHISASSLATRTTPTPRDAKEASYLLLAPPFGEVISTPLSRDGLVCIHIGRDNEHSRLPRFNVLGATCEGDCFILRYDPKTGSQQEMTEEDILSVSSGLERLNPRPEKGRSSFMDRGIVIKLNGGGRQHDKDDIAALGDELFLEKFGPDQAGNEKIELHCHVDPRIFPHRRDFRARHGETVFKFIEACELNGPTLEIGRLEEGKIKHITGASFREGETQVKASEMIFNHSANTGIPAGKILSTAAALPIFSSDLGLVSPGITKADVASYQAAQEANLTRGAQLGALPVYCEGGLKGDWVDASEHVDLINSVGLDVPEDYDPKDRLYVLVFREIARAGIVVPENPSREPTEWPFGGAVMVQSSLDDAWTYQGALMSLMMNFFPRDVTAAAVVEKIVEAEMDPDDGFEDFDHEEDDFGL